MHKGHMRGDHDLDTKRGRSARGRRTDRREMERDRDRNGPGDASDEGANAFASRYQSIEEVCGQVRSCQLRLRRPSGQEHTDCLPCFPEVHAPCRRCHPPFLLFSQLFC